MNMRCCVLLVTVLIAVSPAPAMRSGQRVDEDTDTYAQVLHEYRKGDADTAVTRFTALRRQDFGTEIQRLAESPVDGMLQAAAAIHTEIAFRSSARFSADAEDHLARARVLVQFGEPGQKPDSTALFPVSDEFRRLWYLAIGVQTEFSARIDRIGFDIERGCKLFDDDPEMLLVCGIADEMLASPRVEATDKTTQNRYLAHAERQLRRAVELDRTSVEARLRLGRVLELRGDRTAARELLMSVTAAAAANRTQRYLAALFLARLEKEEGDVNAAQVSYSRALEIFPGAQSARLGLSELRHRAGNRTAATEMLAPPFGEPGVWDPWFGYTYGESWRLDKLLAALRQEARR